MPRNRILILISVLAAAPAASAVMLTYTAISRPGAPHTLLRGVSGDRIIGASVTADGVSHPFIAKGPVVTPFGFPGIQSSQPVDIEGEFVAGNYTNSLGAGLGFVTDGSSWTDVDYPGGLGTSVYGVSGGKAAGYYVASQEPQIVFRGFVFDGTTYTPIDPPGSISTMVLGIDGGRVVGTYADSSFTQHGFVYDGSAFTTIDVPGAIDTRIVDVSGPLMVGTYVDSSVTQHSFLYDGTTFTEIAFSDPGITHPVMTFVEGIDGNRIVGFWHPQLSGPGQDFQTFGFIAAVTVPEPSHLLLALVGAGLLARRRGMN